jgi:hypothetical protein
MAFEAYFIQNLNDGLRKERCYESPERKVALFVGGALMEGERKDRYEAATKAQYEALGRFVQAFELMVFAIRSSIEHRLGLESKNMVFFTRMLFHHSALTAQPLWEMFRAVVYTDVSELRPINPPDHDEFHKILGVIAKEVVDLIKVRNIIIHGTPLIGFISSAQEDFTPMTIHKSGVSATGVKYADAPKSAAEVMALVDRCQRVEKAIRWISGAATAGDQHRQTFKQQALLALERRETPNPSPA